MGYQGLVQSSKKGLPKKPFSVVHSMRLSSNLLHGTVIIVPIFTRFENCVFAYPALLHPIYIISHHAFNRMVQTADRGRIISLIDSNDNVQLT